MNMKSVLDCSQNQESGAYELKSLKDKYSLSIVKLVVLFLFKSIKTARRIYRNAITLIPSYIT